MTGILFLIISGLALWGLGISLYRGPKTDTLLFVGLWMIAVYFVGSRTRK